MEKDNMTLKTRIFSSSSLFLSLYRGEREREEEKTERKKTSTKTKKDMFAILNNIIFYSLENDFNPLKLFKTKALIFH